jgi:hypothetical protein
MQKRDHPDPLRLPEVPDARSHQGVSRDSGRTVREDRAESGGSYAGVAEEDEQIWVQVMRREVGAGRSAFEDESGLAFEETWGMVVRFVLQSLVLSASHCDGGRGRNVGAGRRIHFHFLSLTARSPSARSRYRPFAFDPLNEERYIQTRGTSNFNAKPTNPTLRSRSPQSTSSSSVHVPPRLPITLSLSCRAYVP